MKKDYIHAFSSPLVRASGYFIVFTAGVVVLEIARHLIQARTTLSFIVVLGVIVLLAVIGGVFMCKRNMLSRVVSASTLLALGFIAVKFDGLPTYLLPIALGVSILGAQNFLHRRPKSLLHTIVYSALTAAATLVFVYLFIYSTSVLNHILMYSNDLPS